MSGPSKPSSSGQAWFCTTGLPSDVVFEVGNMSFHLHRFPLMSKCGKIHRLVAEQDSSRNLPWTRKRSHTDKKKEPIEAEEQEVEIVEELEEQEEEAEEGEEIENSQKQVYHISLDDFPGGSGTFETAAKFCYGVKIELTSWNVVPLRCAAEYLEMSEDLAEDNLISCTEKYLNQAVLRHLSEVSKALKSCEDLLPFAEDLGLVQRCVDSIAARVSTSDPLVLFGWPVQESNGNMRTPSRPILWNGLDTGTRRRSRPRSFSTADSWLDDVSFLGLPLYKRVIEAMIARGAPSEVIEGSIVAYADRCIPGLSRLSRRRHSSAPVVSEKEQKELLETVIGNLPPEKSSGMASAKFLFGLLRTASILQVSEASRKTLEQKIGSQLEQATLYDLLIPSYSHKMETLYDVECIERIFKYFMMQTERFAESVSEEEQNGTAPRHVRALTRVGKLLDSYLAEVASDANLKPDRFCELALVLPDQARVYDDGLYRAVDIYLKAHDNLRVDDKERVCGVVDCRKLTMEACTHAAQNDRLPLRAVLQVLFFEQLQLRQAIAGTLGLPEQRQGPHPSSQLTHRREGDHTWQSAVRENQVLRLDMDSMRNRVHELERECSTMKKAIRKIDHHEGPHVRQKDKESNRSNDTSSTTSSRRRKGKYGCKFSTQVCDSHERNVVESKTATKVELSP